MWTNQKRTYDTIDNNKITGKRMTTVNNSNPQRHRREPRWKDRPGGIVLLDCDDDLWLFLVVCEPECTTCVREHAWDQSGVPSMKRRTFAASLIAECPQREHNEWQRLSQTMALVEGACRIRQARKIATST